jgi:hypothetical protein
MRTAQRALGLTARSRPAIVVGEPSEPGPHVIRVKGPLGITLMPLQHPEDRVYRRVRCSSAVPLISTGQSPVRTSPRFRPSGRSALNTSTRSTTRGKRQIPFRIDGDASDEEVAIATDSVVAASLPIAGQDRLGSTAGVARVRRRKRR